MNAKNLLLSLAGLLVSFVSPDVVRAQVGAPPSDYLELKLTDQNGVDVVPALRFDMPEPALLPDPGEAVTFTLPGFTIDFMELSATGQHISDRFRILPCEVRVVSIDGPARTDPILNVKKIPGEALENFLPLQIVAFSDGEHTPGVNQVSDYVRITQGFWNAALGPGEQTFYAEILEPTSEDIPEPRISFVAPPVFFDVAEPLIEDPTGQLISDYVDLPQQVTGAFLSSDNPADYDNLPIGGIYGILVEDAVNGGTLHYDLRFVSHVIPEPATFILLGMGLLFLGLIGRGRVFHNRRGCR